MTGRTADAQPVSPPASASDNRHRGFLRRGLLALTILALVVVSVVSIAHYRRAQEWQHGGERVQVSAQITGTSRTGLSAVLAKLGEPPEPGIVHSTQTFVVQVAWKAPATADGWYEFILLDHRVTPAQPIRAYAGWAPGGKGQDIGSGWAGAFQALSEHYPWLAGTADRLTGTGWVDTASAFAYSATRAGAGTMTFSLGADALPTTRPVRDLSLAIFYVKDDGGVRWAKRVRLTRLD